MPWKGLGWKGATWWWPRLENFKGSRADRSLPFASLCSPSPFSGSSILSLCFCSVCPPTVLPVTAIHAAASNGKGGRGLCSLKQPVTLNHTCGILNGLHAQPHASRGVILWSKVCRRKALSSHQTYPWITRTESRKRHLARRMQYKPTFFVAWVAAIDFHEEATKKKNESILFYFIFIKTSIY